MHDQTIALTLSAMFALTFAAGPAFADSTTSDARPAAAGSEGAPAAGHGKKQFIASYDGNGDASVSRAEFDAQRKSDYARTDADAKNEISEIEYVGEYQTRLDKELAAQRARQLKQAHVRFGVLDANKDGKISEAEYNASGDRIFRKLDTNGDGVIDEKDSAEGY